MGRKRKPQKRIFSDDGWLYYCSMCQGYKPEVEFHKDKNRPFGVYYICKEHRQLKYREINPPVEDMDHIRMVFVSDDDYKQKDLLLTRLGYDIKEEIHKQFLQRVEEKYGKAL